MKIRISSYALAKVITICPCDRHSRHLSVYANTYGIMGIFTDNVPVDSGLYKVFDFNMDYPKNLHSGKLARWLKESGQFTFPITNDIEVTWV